MIFSEPLHVVDDDDSMRDAISAILVDAGYAAQTWASGTAFIGALSESTSGVVVLDLQMPGLNGLALINQLNQAKLNIQIIFISGHAQPPDVIAAFHRGAADFLLKPFTRLALLEAVEKSALVVSQNRLLKLNTQAAMAKFNTLTPREKEIFKSLASGMTIKGLTMQYQLAEITVKVHKAQIMRKLEIDSFQDILRFSQSLPSELLNLSTTDA
jgi:FixJ family two-component response regulator